MRAAACVPSRADIQLHMRVPCLLSRALPRLALAAISKGVSPNDLLFRIAGSGLAFYLYNEVSMYTLDSVHPITHAVGNTIKRVILILYSVLRFGSTLNLQGKLGSAIAIAGVFAYSVAKSQCKPAAPPGKAN